MKRFIFLFFCLLIAASVLLAQAPQPRDHAEINPDYLKWLEQKQKGTLTSMTADGHALGYIPPMYKKNVNLNQSGLQKPMADPASYDLRNTGGVTSVKDQGSCGGCWTFAAMAVLESRWQIAGYGTYDLSEDNLNTCHTGFVWEPCAGGNYEIAANYLARWSGPYSEAEDPYDESHTTVDCPSGLTLQGFVDNAWYLPTDAASIKSALQTYGAVYTNMYYNAANYNAGNYTYYYSGAEGTNHAVTIVGWDDNKATAGGTGAWIIKNSWSSGWGDGGYFYLAYNSSSINNDVGIFPSRLAYNANAVQYKYDETGWTGWNTGYSNTVGYGMVKFTASGNHLLSKVSTWANTDGSTVEIWIYDDFNGTTLSNELAHLAAQSCTYAGYYTWDLGTDVNMTSGNDFYVKVKYTTPGYNLPIPFEKESAGYSTCTLESGVFWISSNGSSWTAKNDRDPVIRVYATPGTPPPSAPTVTTQAVSGIGQTSATGNGNLTSLGSANPTAHGFCWNTTGTPTTANSNVDLGGKASTGAFTGSLSGLTANTPYYVRAYATNTVGTAYGDQVTFTTTDQTFNISGTVTLNGNPLAGVTMSLTGSSSSSTTTDASGNYSFSGLASSGSYTVTPSKNGYTFTPSSRDYSNCVTNQTAQDYTAAAGGVIISGTVTLTGAPLAGVTMTLSGSSSATATTDASGNYSFTVASGGSYTVTPAKTNYSFTPANYSYTNLTTDQTAQNFAADFITYMISGTVTFNGSPLSGAQVALTGDASQTITTVSNGAYSFTVDAGGSYTVTPTKANFTFTPTNYSYTNLSADQTDQDFTGAATTYSISGAVTLTGAPLAGVTITLSGGSSATTTTDASGNYSFTGLFAGGDFTVTPSKIYHSFTPANYSYTNLMENKTSQNFTAALQTYTISGAVTSGATPLAGVLLTLSAVGGDGKVLEGQTDQTDQTVTTGADGVYSFSAAAGGDYTVTPAKANYSFTPANYSYTALGENKTAQNFSASLNNYTISGTVRENALPLAGVTVTLSGDAAGTVTTVSNGVYSFTVTGGGNYVVTPAKTGYSFTPANHSFTNLSATQSGQNFTASQSSFTINGAVTFDGAPLSGVLVTLSASGGGLSALTAETVTTGADGAYSFTAAAGGDYMVTPSKTNYSFTPANYTYTALSEAKTAQNFSATLNNYTISGTVRENAQSLEGVTVTLSGDAAGTVTTVSNGVYSFTVTGGGDYTVTPTKTGYTFSPTNYSYTDLSASQSGQNFTASQSSFTISGAISASGSPLSGVLVTLSGDASQTLTTVSNGAYSFTVSAGGDYAVTPTKTGYTFSPTNYSYTDLSASQSGQNFTASQSSFTISGAISASGSPLSGVLVTLSGDASQTLTTVSNGAYSFTVSAGGNYTVQPQKQFYSFTPSNAVFNSLAANQSQNFSAAAVLPGAPVLTSPADESVERPLDPWLSWQTELNSETYTLEVATDNAFSHLVASQSNLATMIVQISGLDYYTIYYWRVKGVNPHGAGSWSDIWSFRTLMPDLAAQIVLPTQNVTIEEGESVYFQGSEPTVNTPVVYHWDFGDGRSASVMTPGDVAFNTAGIYTVTYWYATTDGLHESNRATRQVTVEEPSVTIPLIFTVPPYHEIVKKKAWIKWQTNLPSEAEFRLGVSKLSLEPQTLPEGPKTSHFAALTRLQSNQWYYYQVLAFTDEEELESAIDSFLIRAETEDSQPPYVIRLLIFKYKTKAYLYFSYNEPSVATLFYWINPQSVTQSLAQNDYAKSHWFQLSNLQPNTTYYFELSMMDMSGNTGWFPPRNALAKAADDSPDSSFSTTDDDDSQLPAFTAWQVFLHHNGQLGMSWQTDEPCTYKLELSQSGNLIGAFSDTAEYEIERTFVATGLENGATYRVSLLITDPEGNETQYEADVQIEASTPQAPQCNFIGYEVMNDNLLVHWTSDQPATSELRWGRSTAALDQALAQNELTTDHWMALNDVALDQDVYFQVRACQPTNDICADWSSVEHYTAVDVAEGGTIPHLKSRMMDYHYGYPNPFNSRLSVVYRLKTAGKARVEIFNSLGQILSVLDDQYRAAGEYRLTWNGHDATGRAMPTGIYFYRILCGNEIFVRKISLVK